MPTLGSSDTSPGRPSLIIDTYGLADPFCPDCRPRRNGEWGTTRAVCPEGYLESVKSGRNRIVDPDLALLYEQIRIVTTGPLWSRRRWRAIVALNLRATS